MGIREILNEREGSGTSEEYEIISGKGRTKMLTLLKRDGSVHCANYAYLHGVAGGGRELRLDFARYMVHIKGANLNLVQQGLADHRVTFLRESNPDLHLPQEAVRIEQIVILHGPRGDSPPPAPRAVEAAVPSKERFRDLPGKVRTVFVRTKNRGGQFHPWGRGAAC